MEISSTVAIYDGPLQLSLAGSSDEDGGLEGSQDNDHATETVAGIHDEHA